MKRILQLIRCEFVKDFSLVKIALCGVILFLVSWIFLSFVSNIYYRYHETPREFYQENVDYIIQERDNAIADNAAEPTFYHQLSEDVYTYMVPYYEDALDNPIDFIEYYLTLFLRSYSNQLVLESLIEHYGTDYATQLILDDDPEFNRSNSYDSIIKYSSYTLEDLNQELVREQTICSILEQVITTGEYYHVAEYWQYINPDSNGYLNRCYQYIIDNKIVDEDDVRIQNQCFYYELEAQEKELVVPTLEEFMDADPYQYFWLETYDQVVRYYEIQNEKIDQDKQIVEYAIEHNVPHGIVEASESYDYVEPTSQTYMDYGLYLAFAVIILLTICYAGTISNEHKMGTVKLLYTRKATRFEVTTAKLIYVIMNLYVLWIIASVIFFFLVGSQYGFADLFGSKIITLFGNTMSVPYLLWYFVSMLICSLPLLFYVAVLVLCSAFIPTTAVTSVLMTVGTIFFSIIWILINLMWSVDISAVAFLPFSYIEYAFTYFKSSFYMYSVARTGVPMGSYGLVVSLVCAVLVFIATIIFYQKKDIKN